MKIKIFTLGGAIDKTYFDRKSTYQAREPKVVEILQAMHVNFETARKNRERTHFEEA